MKPDASAPANVLVWNGDEAVSVVNGVDSFELEDQLRLLKFEDANDTAGDVVDWSVNSHLAGRSYRAAAKGGGAELEHVAVNGGRDGQAGDDFSVANHVGIKNTR